MSEQYSGEMIVGLMNTVGKVLMPLVIPTQSQGRDGRHYSALPLAVAASNEPPGPFLRLLLLTVSIRPFTERG